MRFRVLRNALPAFAAAFLLAGSLGLPALSPAPLDPLGEGTGEAAAQPSAPPAWRPPFDPAALAAIDPSDPATLAEALAPGLAPKASSALAEGLALESDATAIAEGFAAEPTLVAALERAAARMGVAPAAPGSPVVFTSFAEAVPALGATAGIAVPDAGLPQLAGLDAQFPEPLRSDILGIIAGMVAAAQLRERAFAALSDDDMAVLAAAAQDVASGVPLNVAGLMPLVQRIDLAAMLGAGRAMASAMDVGVARLQEHVHLWPTVEPAPLPGPGPGPGPTPFAPYVGCAGLGAPYVPPPFLIAPLDTILQIGNFAPNCYGVHTILSIDPGPGGSSPGFPGDVYMNNAGGTNPLPPYPNVLGTGTFFPVAAAIDLAGDDDYHSPPAIPAAPPFQDDTFIQGGALLGVGALVDVGGDDDYASNMMLDGCPFPPMGSPLPVHYDFAFLQGAAAFGVGLMYDGEGSDRYNSYIDLHNCDYMPPGFIMDDVDYTVRFAQGSALTGVGVLIDAGTPDGAADDAYNSFNSIFAEGMDVEFPGGPGNGVYVADHTQGSSAMLGVGAMVDADGDDRYNSFNTVTTTPNPVTQPLGLMQAVGTYSALCSQGAAGLCYETPPVSPCVTLVGSTVCLPAIATTSVTGSNALGALADVLGDDKYNCANFLDSQSMGEFTGDPSYEARVVQGAVGGMGILPSSLTAASSRLSVDAALGVHAELEGNDCYNSGNTVLGSGFGLTDSFYEVDTAQGSGRGALAVGVLADRAQNDRYNCDNNVTASNRTELAIRFVQGHGSGQLAAGIHADTTTPQGEGADCYNSWNAQASRFDALSIQFSQGTSGAGFDLGGGTFGSGLNLPLGIGLLVDLDSVHLDPLSPDFFNSENTGAFGSLGIYVAQGAVHDGGVLPPGMVPTGGIGIMVEAGAHNEYNFNNAGFPLAAAWLGVQLQTALGVAPSVGDVGVFVDVSLETCQVFWLLGDPLGLGPTLSPLCPNPLLGPDDYGSFFANGVLVGGNVGCAGAGLAAAIDLWDGNTPFFLPPPYPPIQVAGAPAPANGPTAGFLWPVLSFPPLPLCVDF